MKTSSAPLVSIVIPAHNGEKYLTEAIQSVLNQNYPRYEIWVLDNGSTDNTQYIACSFPQVQYQYEEKANTALARNQGISLAQGEYIAFLDQDDIWVSEKLTKQVSFLEEQKDYEAVVSLQKMYLQPGHTKPHWLKQEFLEKPQSAYLPSALLVRRSTFARTNSFNLSFSLASDVAWFFKAKHEGIKIGMIEEVLIHRRIHNKNTSNEYSQLQKEILSTIHHSLKERRKNHE